MKTSGLLQIFSALFVLFSFDAVAQSEGAIKTKGRVSTLNDVYLGYGVSSPQNNEVYSSGWCLELGYRRRFNSILSAGVSFNTSRINAGDGDGLVVSTFGPDIKLNVIPVTDQSKVSVFVLLKPTFGTAKHTSSYLNGVPASQSVSAIFVGPGFEYKPAGPGLGFYAQLGYASTSKITLYSDQFQQFTESAALKMVNFTAGLSYKF